MSSLFAAAALQKSNVAPKWSAEAPLLMLTGHHQRCKAGECKRTPLSTDTHTHTFEQQTTLTAVRPSGVARRLSRIFELTGFHLRSRSHRCHCNSDSADPYPYRSPRQVKGAHVSLSFHDQLAVTSPLSISPVSRYTQCDCHMAEITNKVKTGWGFFCSGQL